MNWTLQSAFQLLRQAAERVGAVVDEAEPELVGDRMNTEAWGDVQLDAATERVRRDLPDFITAARLDGIPVLFGLVEESGDLETVRDALRRYRNQATIARSWLSVDAHDLQLFLIGPPGVATDPSWRETARRIEADDRVCRKLVWLPPLEPTVDAAKMFLRRTFLATPWQRYQTSSAAQLDQLSEIPLPPEWLDALQDEGLGVEALVARLVEVTE